MKLWGVAVLELDIHPVLNKEPDHAPCPCAKTHPIYHISYSHTTLQTTNPLIVRPLSGSPNDSWK